MNKLLTFAAAVALDLLTLGVPALADSGAAVVPGSVQMGGPNNPQCVFFQTYVAGSSPTVDTPLYGFSARDPSSAGSMLLIARSEDLAFPITFGTANPGLSGTGTTSGWPNAWFPGDCTVGVTYVYKVKG